MTMSLERAKDRIKQLEDAIKRLDLVRKHLMKNASEICKEVHGSINFSIDCIRSRELHLLEEVNEVRVNKEESLQIQQARLKQAVDILCTAVTLVTENPASEKHLVDTLDRLTQLELSPEETPYISFKVDNVHTREHLLSYGRVDANGFPLSRAFEDPDKPSASLPRHVEEYDDCDHHVFYKTLQEFKKPDAGTNIKVNIPKLSQRPEDWLQKKSQSASANTNRPNLKMPLNMKTSLGGSQCEDSSNSCSLNNWLSLIKNHSDLEEEHNFEIVDNTSIKANNTGIIPSSDLKIWLNPSSSSKDQVTTGLFNHISRDSKTWLKNVCNQLANVESSNVLAEKTDLFQHISRESSTWLRAKATRHNLQQEEKDFFSHISKDKKKWLCIKAQSVKRKFEEDQSKNEEDDTSPSKNKWLLRKSSLTESVETKRPGQFQPSNPWLMTTSLDASKKDIYMSASKSYPDVTEKIDDKTDVSWLMENLSEISINTHDSKKDLNDDNEMSEEPKDFNKLSDWLFVPQSQKSVEGSIAFGSELHSDGDKDSSIDSWSVYSVPQSVSSDQLARDVAVAEDYYNKWLL